MREFGAKRVTCLGRRYNQPFREQAARGADTDDTARDGTAQGLERR